MNPDGGACSQCRSKKHRCSLVPQNSETGKADRHRYTRSEVLEYRMNIQKSDAATATGEQGAAAAVEKQGVETAKGKQGAAAAKGKQPAAPPQGTKRIRGSPEASEPEDSYPAPSPSISLAALETLALESGGSSAANTAADSPASASTFPRLRIPKPAASISLMAPEGSRTSQSSASKSFYKLLIPALTQGPTGFDVVVEPASKFLKPGRKHTSHSPTDASPTSDTGSITARVVALERKMELYERKQESLDKWKRDIEKRLKKLEA